LPKESDVDVNMRVESKYPDEVAIHDKKEGNIRNYDVLKNTSKSIGAQDTSDNYKLS
jgi:hypothetical protein